MGFPELESIFVGEFAVGGGLDGPPPVRRQPGPAPGLQLFKLLPHVPSLCLNQVCVFTCVFRVVGSAGCFSKCS